MAEIRPYAPEDSKGVKDLILSVLKQEYPFDTSLYQDSDINDISGTYKGSGSAFFVATDGARIIGCAGVKNDSGTSALLRRLFVDSNNRRKGIGTRLIETALAFARSQNYKEIAFRATDRMKSAMGLCRKMGFKEKDDLEISGFHVHQLMLKL